jgi:hypothetical protein
MSLNYSENRLNNVSTTCFIAKPGNTHGIPVDELLEKIKEKAIIAIKNGYSEKEYIFKQVYKKVDKTKRSILVENCVGYFEKDSKGSIIWNSMNKNFRINEMWYDERGKFKSKQTISFTFVEDKDIYFDEKIAYFNDINKKVKQWDTKMNKSLYPILYSVD